MIFENRFDAANKLLKPLAPYARNSDVVIIAIPRGGLELGIILAQGLKAPLDIIFAKKISYPNEPEYAIGAVTSDEAIIEKPTNVSTEYIDQEVQRVRAAIKAKEWLYKPVRSAIDLHNKIVILVDDGIATGNTIAVALKTLRQQKPKKLIVAVPVASREALAFIKPYTDSVICLMTPETFFGIGQFYRNFPQVSDETAIALLRKSNL